MHGPNLHGWRKSIEEIVGMVDSVRDRIHAISITSGVLTSIEEEEAYVLAVVNASPPLTSRSASPFILRRIHLIVDRELGVVEVKFNLEAATPELFAKVCPGLDYERIWKTLTGL